MGKGAIKKQKEKRRNGGLGKVFSSRMPLLSGVGWGGVGSVQATANYFIGVDEKASYWLINIMFLGEVETAV